MRRYTLRLRVPLGAVTALQAKEALTNVLLRLPVTLRFGAAGEAEPGLIALELATDLPRETLLEKLTRPGVGLPGRLERLDWGWAAGAAEGVRDILAPSSSTDDPYGAGHAQVSEAKDYTYGPSQTIRMIFIAAAVVLAVIDLIARSRYGLEIPWMDFIILAIWILGLPALLSTRLFAKPVSQTRCNREGLEIRYRLGFAPRRLAWDEILGFEILGEKSRLYGSGFSLHISTGSLREARVLLATIVQRAGLRFVEGIPLASNVVYKRSDAP